MLIVDCSCSFFNGDESVLSSFFTVYMLILMGVAVAEAEVPVVGMWARFGQLKFKIQADWSIKRNVNTEIGLMIEWFIYFLQ